MDNYESLFGAVFVSLIVGFAIYLNVAVKQKVYILPNLELSKNSTTNNKLDTVVADKSRWYYVDTDDTLQKDIRVTFFKDKVGPYEVIHTLQPGDFFNVKMKGGLNIIHIQELGTYPTRSKRILITKINEVK